MEGTTVAFQPVSFTPKKDLQAWFFCVAVNPEQPVISNCYPTKSQSPHFSVYRVPEETRHPSSEAMADGTWRASHFRFEASNHERNKEFLEPISIV